MEVKINKEIRNFKESIFFGLSIRQFIFTILACVVSVAVYFLLKNRIGMEILSWMCVLSAVPFAIIGYVRYNDMPAEKLIIAWIKSEILTPKKLKFKSENIYYKNLQQFNKSKKGGAKVENRKKAKKKK